MNGSADNAAVLGYGRDTAVRIVKDCPHALSLGTSCSRANNSVTSLGGGKWFQPRPWSAWVPF